MTSALDTNVILDIAIPNAPHAEWARRAIDRAMQRGGLIISEATYAELAPFFPMRDEVNGFLAGIHLELTPSGESALHAAGRAWRRYTERRGASGCPNCGAPQRPACERCGSSLLPRQHVIADFMIGAHALIHAGRLLTRDRGFFAQYFPDLQLETP